jgi:hypothetical protein
VLGWFVMEVVVGGIVVAIGWDVATCRGQEV